MSDIVPALAICISAASIVTSALTVHYARMAGRQRDRLRAIQNERAAAARV